MENLIVWPLLTLFIVAAAWGAKKLGL